MKRLKDPLNLSDYMRKITTTIRQVKANGGPVLTPEFWKFLASIASQKFKKVGRITQIT